MPGRPPTVIVSVPGEATAMLIGYGGPPTPFTVSEAKGPLGFCAWRRLARSGSATLATRMKVVELMVGLPFRVPVRPRSCVAAGTGSR
jgi:hypothetical protein